MTLHVAISNNEQCRIDWTRSETGQEQFKLGPL